MSALPPQPPQNGRRPTVMPDEQNPALMRRRSTMAGQHDRRVTVALPASLSALESLCRSSFAVKGAIKLWCNGKIAVNQAEYELIKDGDVIIVEWDGRKMSVAEIAQAFSTTSLSSYPAHQVQPRQPAPRQQYSPSKAKFDGETTNHHDYQAWPLEKRQAAPAPAARASVPFEGQSTTQHDYVAYQVQPRQPAPRQEYSPSKAKFDGETTNHHDYQAWPLEKRQAAPAPAARASVPFEGQSTTQHDYVAHQVQPRQPAPRQEYSPSKAKFDGETTSHHDYTGHQPEKRLFIHLGACNLCVN